MSANQFNQQKPLMPIAEALSTMLALVQPIANTESVNILQALDRVLAEDIISAIDVPGFDNSAMDGYAFRAQDASLEQPLELVGTALAGQAYAGTVTAGQCVRIMTGAVVPAGADTVIMQEQVTFNADQQQICLTKLPKVGDNIRRAGEDIAKQQQVLPAGKRLTAADIGLLASLGIAEVIVKPKLRVAILSTGDELTPPGQPLEAGHIYDSNRYVMHAMLQRLGVDIIDLGLLPDDPDTIETAFKQAMLQADVLITSAGVSVGDADYTKQILVKLGEIDFWKVAIKPGKPFAFGKLEDCWFFGLPGNPVAAVVTLEQLVQPVLRKIAGETMSAIPELLTATCEVALKKRPGRADYQRGWYWQQNSQLFVKTLGSQSSGMLTSIANANCYIVLPQDAGSLESGSTVDILPFSSMLR
ncbi:molybdopterin molybdotransferase MoeA [Rheinheimera sp. MMS21-TC3]|uniref:molybdopterin molybdotransferase MoeA n=1 Tax=Rheinheimera sp. MMS21-TC3 TaxID=3072790 RepID=UPI0028C48AE5|nr:molybdopterin molybdotransferase MoeA [Rheinheimera sp. MMS21-TC3]WNO60597.1 molybdopterin molybdotransferase MoeA [Rheinheimera sp. MMS21-TC3]